MCRGKEKKRKERLLGEKKTGERGMANRKVEKVKIIDENKRKTMKFQFNIFFSFIFVVLKPWLVKYLVSFQLGSVCFTENDLQKNVFRIFGCLFHEK